MRQHGLSVIRTRNTAMLTIVNELPTVVVSDLFGVGLTTAHRWAQYAQANWTDYVATTASPAGNASVPARPTTDAAAAETL
ncbi:hypothetical protein [Nocardia sp. N2S4-5]|uniref:hypothetical protein n=1 Tax=Nocardia sp. N2S4-5 TaxID=3351565 RepID=UPI0037D03C37